MCWNSPQSLLNKKVAYVSTTFYVFVVEIFLSLESLFCSQFHQQFMNSLCADILLLKKDKGQSQTINYKREKLLEALLNKKAWVKCWWIWHLVLKEQAFVPVVAVEAVVVVVVVTVLLPTFLVSIMAWVELWGPAKLFKRMWGSLSSEYQPIPPEPNLDEVPFPLKLRAGTGPCSSESNMLAPCAQFHQQI